MFAGQYQPDPLQTLRQTNTPVYVKAVGNLRSYKTNNENIHVALRPESITTVDEATRDQWVRLTARDTLDRIIEFDPATDEVHQLAHEQYDLSLEEFRDEAIAAREQV